MERVGGGDCGGGPDFGEDGEDGWKVVACLSEDDEGGCKEG
jgi:hypothetical protein